MAFKMALQDVATAEAAVQREQPTVWVLTEVAQEGLGALTTT